ncbi:hypothetical protein [Blastococcus brunescens]|uniref:Glyoxalase/fosfomycin resistance/dioxygenase domain-containing protein n=1 Tax=Blastococcus brunescens TaxID=1564165 RepID=A0ABZ1B763_9ACTN|nr:hypothetical protein [Blastococcus sp. BMG 8361]WRL66626.1 hypothetical protein U6N30_15245 [Blastococcus sp. BMG 8361]
MTQRLITHLRHVDLAVPDFATQLDFYSGIWGLAPSTPTRGWRSWPQRGPRSSTSCGCARPPTSGST